MYAKLYEKYFNFRESYFHLKNNERVLNPSELIAKASITNVNFSRHREVIQSGIKTQDPTTSDTAVYCLIFHKKEYSLKPLTEIVQEY